MYKLIYIYINTSIAQSGPI